MVGPDPNAWRRRLLRAGAVLPLGLPALPQGADRDDRATPDARTLVACFSRTGNTLVLARKICVARSAGLFEIEPADRYPEDYEQTVARATRERLDNRRPSLRDPAPALHDVDTVFLGFPVWGMSPPAVIRSFLSQVDLSGKTLVPFITHGGYGIGDSMAVLATHAPQAKLAKTGLVMQADQERETAAGVRRWLADMAGGHR